MILSRLRSRNPTLQCGSLVVIRKFHLRIRCLTQSTEGLSSFAKMTPAPTSGRASLLTFSQVDSRLAPLITRSSMARKSRLDPFYSQESTFLKLTGLFDVVGRCRQFVPDVQVPDDYYRLAIFEVRVCGVNSVRIDNPKWPQPIRKVCAYYAASVKFGELNAFLPP